MKHALIIAVLSATQLFGADTPPAKGNPMFLQGPVVVTPALAEAHAFPRFTASFDLSNTAMLGELFPAADVLVSLSGPPGGPSHFVIRLIRSKPGEALPTLEQIVRELDTPQNKFELGVTDEIEIAGAKRKALLWSLKNTPWVDSNASVLIPFPDSRTALYISFSASASKAGEIQAGASQNAIVKSLKITF